MWWLYEYECLCLLQLLGRALNIGDYVKRGEQLGWIKISLRGNAVGEIIVITRKIDRQNRSEWQINGMAEKIVLV